MSAQLFKKEETLIKRKCWITEEFVKSVCKNDELYKKLQTDPENIELATEYRTYRNKLNELIKITKTSYYMKKIEERKKHK